MFAGSATTVDLFDLLVIAALAAVMAFMLTPLVRRLALWVDATDLGGGRRIHSGRVARLGGLAVLMACLAAAGGARLCGIDLILVLRESGWSPGWLLAGSLLVCGVGAIDDVRGLGVLAKLAAQIVAGLLALAGGYGFHALTNPFVGGYIDLGALGPFLTVLWVVGITNAFNLIDGLDGLAAGVSIIVCSTLVVVSLVEGRGDAALMAALLGGAMSGFLWHNFPPAKIFLGDSGALLLGYVLSIVSIQSLQKGATSVVILAPVLALGLPIMETSVTVIRRWFSTGATSIFAADREHLHHRLLARGMSHRRAVFVLYAACLAFGAVAYIAILARDQGRIHALIVGGVAVATFIAVRVLYRRPSGATQQAAVPHERDGLAVESTSSKPR